MAKMTDICLPTFYHHRDGVSRREITRWSCGTDTDSMSHQCGCDSDGCEPLETVDVCQRCGERVDDADIDRHDAIDCSQIRPSSALFSPGRFGQGAHLVFRDRRGQDFDVRICQPREIGEVGHVLELAETIAHVGPLAFALRETLRALWSAGLAFVALGEEEMVEKINETIKVHTATLRASVGADMPDED